jgi:hypothetical protein
MNPRVNEFQFAADVSYLSSNDRLYVSPKIGDERGRVLVRVLRLLAAPVAVVAFTSMHVIQKDHLISGPIDQAQRVAQSLRIVSGRGKRRYADLL